MKDKPVGDLGVKKLREIVLNRNKMGFPKVEGKSSKAAGVLENWLQGNSLLYGGESNSNIISAGAHNTIREGGAQITGRINIVDKGFINGIQERIH